MRLSPPTLVFGAVCFAAGIFLQHRWPLGRLRAALGDMPEPVPLRLEDITRLPHHRRLVIVVSGQSNAANYVDERRSAGPGVFIFHRGKLFPAVDPLPGGDGNGGSIWSRLGARLAVAGKFDAVIFAVAAQGSSTAEEWAPGGSLHKRFFSTLVDLRDAGLSPQLLLWQQGETELGPRSNPGALILQTSRPWSDQPASFPPRPAFLSPNRRGARTPR